MQNKNAEQKKVLILGVGNELLSDEGIGIHTVKELSKKELPPEVEVMDGGTDGFSLINVIVEADRLILIDCVRGGSKPGTIYKFDIEDAPSCSDKFKTSVHQISILEVIHLSELVGKTPETTVFGVEPKSISTSMELTSDVKAKIPRVIELVLEEVDEFLKREVNG
ncbi:HyaD/HybD family hydrogenase maturation endopeptidase [candidate division KSB1 bacterium]|nr:HyaD/HybD family hydrogenase maturation endopeptidase [candidate division KSB1 bacterium]